MTKEGESLLTLECKVLKAHHKHKFISSRTVIVISECLWITLSQD